MDVDRVTAAIVDSAMKVHSALGPGLLESVYEKCLKHELTKRGFKVESQLWLPVVYDGVQVEGGYEVDLLVEIAVIIELKVVEKILEVHKAQLLSYLKLGDKSVGLLINFNVVHLRDGIRRLVNNYPEPKALTAVPA
jgi:GxxExxY protein